NVDMNSVDDRKEQNTGTDK
ncbi:hypothetical protein XELAEV_180457673mg, partial [Xenopus laevis]